MYNRIRPPPIALTLPMLDFTKIYHYFHGLFILIIDFYVCLLFARVSAIKNYQAPDETPK